jgi:hypothetical protein
MKTKTFDCVEMKREAALRVHERLKDMTVEQQIEYWRQRSEEFQGEQERLRAQAGGIHREGQKDAKDGAVH